MNNLILTYLESKIDYYKHEVNNLKLKTNLMDYEEEQLKASREMLNMFIEIEAKLKAWDIIKDFAVSDSEDIIEFEAIFANRGKAATDYVTIKKALKY
jgi:hypothetical protein